MQFKAPKHPAWLIINHVYIFIVRPVTADLERRDDVAERLFKIKAAHRGGHLAAQQIN